MGGRVSLGWGRRGWHGSMKLDVENSGVESVKRPPTIRMQRRFHVCRNMEQQP